MILKEFLTVIFHAIISLIIFGGVIAVFMKIFGTELGEIGVVPAAICAAAYWYKVKK